MDTWPGCCCQRERPCGIIKGLDRRTGTGVEPGNAYSLLSGTADAVVIKKKAPWTLNMRPRGLVSYPIRQGENDSKRYLVV